MKQTLCRLDVCGWRPFTLGVFALAVLLGCGSSDLREEARQLQQMGQYEASMVPLRALLDQQVNEPEVDMLYGIALQRTGSPVMAIWALRRAMEDPEWFEPAGLTLAVGLQQAMQYDQAIEVTSELLDRDPDNVSALVIRAMARAGSRRDYEGVIEDADRALAIDPDVVNAQVARTIALLGLDRADEAGDGIAAVEAYYANDELNEEHAARYCAARASFEAEKGELERAGEVFETCLERYPLDATVVSAAVEHFENQNQSDRALDILRKAVVDNPLADDFRIALVRRLDTLGHGEEAIALLQAATESDRRTASAQAWFDLAGYQMSRGATAQGIEAYEKAIELLTNVQPSRVFAFADALIQAGEYERALELAEGMTVLPHRELVRGRVYFEQGNSALALEHLSAGLALWPDNGIARYFAARAADDLGDFDRAIGEYRYTIRIDAAATDARARLARLYLADGKPATALEVIRHDNQRAPPDMEMALVELEILDQLGRLRGEIPAHLANFNESPEFRESVLIRIAEIARRNAGASGAIALIEGAEGLDLSQPQSARVLRMMIGDLISAGRVEEASERIADALDRYPDAAVFHAIRGSFLDQTGAPAGDIQSAFMRAIQLDPEEAYALAGRASGLVEEGRIGEAVEFYRRSAEADPTSTEPLLAAIALLQEARDSGAARDLLELLLERDPYNGAAALELARLKVDGEAGIEVQALARRAARFDGGSEADALLDAVSSPPSSETPAGAPSP